MPLEPGIPTGIDLREATRLTAEYAQTDGEVVDYEVYCLDPEILDRATKGPLLLRGPRPSRLEPGSYFVCLGAAQTFGRFCQKPFPTLLAERLGLDAVNLGRGGAGPAFFAEENQRLMTYVNGARFAVVQVMAGRSESNSLFTSRGLGHYTRVSDGTGVGCDQAFRELLEQHDVAFVKAVVEETRANWVRSYRRLLDQIHVPKILLWFAMRTPDYTEAYDDVYALFGDFPQLVTGDMVKQVRAGCDAYVELVSRRGVPHRLVSRHTGEPVTVRDPWGGVWKEDWYYGSPEMHADAAAALEPACTRLPRASKVTSPIAAPRRSDPEASIRRFIILGKARCGSTFLRSLLNSHPRIRAFGELFRDTHRIGWDLPGYDLDFQSPALIEEMRSDPVAFLEDHVFGVSPPEIDAVGFKLFYYHASDERGQRLWDHLAKRPDLFVIHLKRHNTLQELLSLRRAERTNEWYRTDAVEREVEPIELDVESCRRAFEYARDAKRRFDAFFSGCPMLQVTYEDLVRSRDAEAERVQRFLGVEVRPLAPSIVKQSRAPLSAAIANYRELEGAFRGTPWEGFFDDEA